MFTTIEIQLMNNGAVRLSNFKIVGKPCLSVKIIGEPELYILYLW